MGSVGDYIEACVCPYCFIYNDKGYIVRVDRRPAYRTFETRRQFVNHLRKRHPDSFTLAVIKAVA